MKKNLLFTVLGLGLLFISCSEEEGKEDENPVVEMEQSPSLPETLFNYADLNLPEHYTTNSFPVQFPFQHASIEMDNTPLDNPVTNEGATLGRVLFYDMQLSANGTIACASCHKAEHGFADPEVLSVGFEGGLTRRHSMGLTNARFYSSGRFFWDERAASLEDQVLEPFQDPTEMGLSLETLVNKVEEQTFYAPLFEEAFGDPSINSDRISKALAQFIRSMVSTTSKYDMARSEVDDPIDDFPSFTAQENMGKRLFYLPRMLENGLRANCAGCHVSESFVGPMRPNGPQTSNATNNGLDAVSIDDLGVYETSGNLNDIGNFKVPSLRNVGIRPPYMHDGRFSSLEEVVEHYSSGVQNHENLRPPLAGPNGEAVQFNFTQEEQEALVAFLHTLTDYEMLEDEKYSNPFH